MDIACDMRLDNAEGVYRPGEMLTGDINVIFREPALIKALALKVIGYATTNWVKPPKKSKQGKPAKEKKKQKQVIYSQYESYLSTTNYLIGSDNSSARSMEPGSCHYNFSVSLPPQCPTNFESTVGQIRYELEVFIDAPDMRISLYKRHFNVKRSLNLNSVVGLNQPYNLEKIEQKSFMQFWRRPMQMQLSVSRLGFVPGENITVQVKVLNYDLVNLTELIYKFNLVSSYSGIYKKKAESTIERRNLTTITQSLFGQSGTVVNALQTLHVPEDLPSTLYIYDCRCIQISYEVEVQLISYKNSRNLSAVIPITIGTVSLVECGNQQNQFAVHARPLNAARSMSDLTSMPSAPPQTPGTEQASVTVTTNASMSNTSFREADFMPSAKLCDKNKHSKSMDQINFKPKYLYYNINNPTVEEELFGESNVPSLKNIPQYPNIQDLDAIHIDTDYKAN